MHPFEDPDSPVNTVADIDLAALRHNVAVLRHAARGVPIMGVVKADAYGHGAVPCAEVLVNEGVGMLAVATIDEGRRLRESGIRVPVLVFAAALPEHLPAYDKWNLDLTVSSVEVARRMLAERPHLARQSHVKLDTGMGRLGLSAQQFSEVAQMFADAGARAKAAWTHLVAASDPAGGLTRAQFSAFNRVVAESGLPHDETHVMNSGSLLNHIGAHEGAWARLGVTLYGIQHQRTGVGAELKPVMHWLSRIVHVKQVEAGAGISYKHTWRAPRKTTIATVGAGYADGYRRLLSNRSWVGVGKQKCPVVGAVCMDMFMIDLGPDGRASPGDTVVLMGTGGPSTLELAEWASTISYEICCGVTGRVPRRYLG